MMFNKSIFVLLLNFSLVAFATHPVQRHESTARSRDLQERQEATASPDRVAAAQAKLDEIWKLLKPDVGTFENATAQTSATVYGRASVLDMLSGQETNKARVLAGLKTRWDFATFDDYTYFNEDLELWAPSAVLAYEAYGEEWLLEAAIETWLRPSRSFVTNKHVQEGQHPLMEHKLAKCDDKTMVGGVTWRHEKDDNDGIDTTVTSLYVAMSALLAETTRQKRFRDAAVLSADWVANHGLTTDKRLIYQIKVDDCTKRLRNPDSGLYSYAYIEGLATLASVSENPKWGNLLKEILDASKVGTQWEGPTLAETDGGYGFPTQAGRYVFSLALLHLRTDGFPEVSEYINRQYEGITKLASEKGKFYDAWFGSNADTNAAIGVLDILVAGAAV